VRVRKPESGGAINSKFMVKTIACGVPIVSRGAGDTAQVKKNALPRF
jgi:hypothetical protein